MERDESMVPKQETIKRDKIAQEIERKFLVKSLPEDLEQYSHEKISQGYVAITEDGTEVRARQKGDKFFQTIKSGGGQARSETEFEITEEQFNALWRTTEGKRLEKIRYNIPCDDLLIELDVYKGQLEGLMSAEVEFESLEESDRFIPPEWMGKDISEDKRYKNQNLALHGLPKEDLPKKEKNKEKLDIPEYELGEGVARLAEMVQEKISQKEGTIIVEVAGGSASGKTSAVAAKLKEKFGGEAVIFSMDDYYRGKTFMEEEAHRGNELNWDQPEALDLELLKNHLKELKNGTAIQKPIYSFKTGEPIGTENLPPRRVIIVEGLFALDGVVKDEGDVRAFVDIGTHGRILRRLLRDIERIGQKPADVLKYFSEVVEPMHEKYVDSTKENADIIIRNEYSPEIEAKHSGLHEIQLKFKFKLDEEALRKAGAERLGTMAQTDAYYNPQDRNLMETGEILRIRQESGKRILTYKGPKIESEFRERPKFEFEIDEQTEQKFLAIYGDCVKTIKKERTLYQMGGAVFSLDSVSKIENEEVGDLGKFIEIRSIDKDISKDNFNKTLTKLGLDQSQGIKESYFEM